MKSSIPALAALLLLPALLVPTSLPAQSAAAGSIIVLSGDPVPGGGTVESVFEFTAPSLNDVDQVALRLDLTGTPGGDSDNVGIYRADGASPLVEIARKGQTAPRGDVQFENFFGFLPINSAGQIALFARPFTLGDSNLIGDGTTLVEIARTGDPVPGGDGQVGLLSTPLINNLGQTGVGVFLRNATFGDRGALYRGEGTALTQIVRDGQTVPGGNGRFFCRSTPSFVGPNDLGQFAFEIAIAVATGGADRGIFRGDGTTLVKIALASEPVPTGVGQFISFSETPALDETGRTAFPARLTGTSGNGDNTGIYFGDENGLIQIVREGQVAPTGNGAFGDVALTTVALNENA